jgi:hypothetical protein
MTRFLTFRTGLLIQLLALGVLTLSASGCGVLLGNIKPVDEKSETYRVLNLSESNPDWKKLEPVQISAKSPDGDPTRATDSTDLAYQSKQTASIISLNSACRPGDSTGSLRDVSQLLFLGLTDVVEREEKQLELEKLPALQTTVQGRLNQEPVKLRAVVLRKGTCVYDLMYVSRPEHFAAQENDFTRFVSSLRLK